ncbi:UDP-N-acetylglucosamine:LPS N-acetylglucosamine transferase [Succiniclasticum ruminis]|uniref:UDP-N-acetylglucosamine:LPS N-acetylglucosamine transferase n=1 Tax=Succiniclasticum ruminis TaxID=40841 RepID=A0A1G6JF80_9FIRM|nr:glycosyltransferase [Succiniclasticum ruminis]SDC17492.1 UDP-N-acetylglucosamine:LPS N-acetylglucosamine transferase [Succiniclasticum ruminis]
MKSEPGNKKLKILIMSAPIGSGHRMAAVALEEALLRLKNVEVVQGNVFDFFPSVIGKAFLNFYGSVLKFCPFLYELSYRWSNQGGGSLWMRNLLNGILLRLGKAFVEEVKPDVVFSTHATPTGILSMYKQKYDPGLWLGVVITDFTVHRWLVCPGVDAYFVADEKLFGQINDAEEHCDVKADVSGSCSGDNDGKPQTENEKQSEAAPGLFATGIPVRSGFALQNTVAESRTAVRKKYCWSEDAFVCLLAGGGGGMLPMEEIVRSLLTRQSEPVHIVAVTGHNDTLRKKLEALCHTFTNHPVTAAGADDEIMQSRLQVFGFTDSMPQLMQAADVVVTKAGGISLAEGLACGANLLIYRPLPGQEQGNTAFLQKEYGVAAVTDLCRLTEYLDQVRTVPVPERLRRQEQQKALYGHPEAAKQIAEFTVALHRC